MTVGPLLGSFITEPAAMTVTALILLDGFFKEGASQKFKYTSLGLLFVAVSIGGTLTPCAAPPVLMVAGQWGWDLSFMLTHFGWKAAVSVFVAAIGVATFFKKEIISLRSDFAHEAEEDLKKIPAWVTIIHLAFLVVIVMTHRHIPVFSGLFLLFIGLYSITREYQAELRLREGLLVAFFLAGIIVLGEPQKWWLEPTLSGLGSFELFMGSIGLTAITDNAALAYLGSQIQGLAEESRYSLIAGSVVGGGLTVIANAPNPVGYGLLNSSFGEDGIKPLYLALAALPFTALAAIVFWLY